VKMNQSVDQSAFASITLLHAGTYVTIEIAP
jgi:hypothetical protein